jgi:hypothetical protein
MGRKFEARATKQVVAVLGGFSLMLFAVACGTGHETTAAGVTPAHASANVPPAHASANVTPAHAPTKAAVAPAAASSSATSVTNAPAAAAKKRTWWHPRAVGPNRGPEFQWELDHALNIRSVTDMGNGVTNGLRRKARNVTVYDIDGIVNPASTVKALHRLHDKVICYIEIGAAGNYYSAAQEGIPVTYFAQLQAAGDLGAAEPGFPEFYLNINTRSTFRIIKTMIRQQCFRKGFDAVEPDIDDSYTDATGFKITEAENIRFDKMLGAYAHKLGLAWGQKNGDNDPQFSAALEPTADFLIDEECNFFDTCAIVTPPYVKAGKLVLNAEYTDDWGSNATADLAKFCAYDISHHVDGTLFTAALAGQRNPCR